MDIILASASPRRRQLLEQVGLSFTVQASEVPEEARPGISPVELAQSLAADKALAVATLANPQSIVIGADTIVVFSSQIFGKPKTAVEAKTMLTVLSGRRHTVITGVAVVAGGQVFRDFTETFVTFRQLSDGEMDRYVAAGEWMDKAGAYGIQGLGALLVERIEGCYNNVVGLPLNTLARLLLKVGVRIL